MKPFTSKHCTQYLTKSSPLNQGVDNINDSRKKTVIKRQRSLNEVEIDQNPDNDFSFVPPKYGGIQEVADNNRKAAKRKISQPTAPKTTRTKFDNASKKAAFIPSTELSDEAIQKMKSRKYKK